MPTLDQRKVDEVFDWLVDGAPGAPHPMAVVGRLSRELVDAGLPLARTEAFVRTLHPHIAGRSFLWTPTCGDAEVIERSYAFLTSTEFLKDPAAQVFATGAPVRVRLATEPLGTFVNLEALRQDGYTDYWAAPLKFLSGQVHAITFATRDRTGFADEHLRALERVLRPLSRVGEILALTRTATNLLNTYVGRNTGERVLAGRIVRGDVESVRCVLWFSDLRDFTALSAQIGPARIIGVLNELFDCQVPAIEAHGGEVLKFIGDGMFAVFPLGMGRTDAEVCDHALAAAEQAIAARAARNAGRAEATPEIRFGVALHIGEVAYGNIGGASRLDFTCIGPAVNLAARLEGLTGKLQRDVVVSKDVAQLSSRSLAPLGAFELKGVAGVTEAFALPLGVASS